MTTTTDPTAELTPETITSTIDDYFACWNAASEDRPGLVARVFADDAYYCDGASEAIGRGAITEMMAAVLTQIPGATVRRASPIDTHHHQARFVWEIVGEDGVPVIDGIDAVRLDQDAKLTTVLGFFSLAVPA